ncbi:MAG: NAD(P)/FAD-dependent oxidoreductase [Minisyncoccota bacterium]
MIYDLTIIGGGPAGVSAGVYAARKLLKTLFISPEFGGQSIVSDDIQNWIGTPHISGSDLAKNLEAHLREYAGDVVDIKNEYTVDIKKSENGFTVTTDKTSYETKTILIATGSHRRKLEIPGADKYDHRGVTYCASCDGPFFTGKDVAIVGGGNAGFESASQLLAYAKSVTLLNRTDKFRADALTVNKLKGHSNFKVITNAIPVEILGDGLLATRLVYEDQVTKEKITLNTPGIFVEIGALPTTEFAKNVVELNQNGYVPVDPHNQQTKTSGIWSAGDCTDGLYHQNNIASGDAVKALEDIYLYLKAK